MICELDTDDFCARHERKHLGPSKELALDPGPRGEQYRARMDLAVTNQKNGKAGRKASRGIVKPMGDGPGTELMIALNEAAFSMGPKCQCEARARQMNTWGPDGCRAHRNEIIGWLIDAAIQAELFTAAAKEDKTAYDFVGGMVDEAIRRAEANEVKKKANRGKDAAGRRIINLLGNGFCRGLGDAITWAWLAEGASEPLTFAASGGVAVMLRMLGQRVVDNGDGGLEVRECYTRETREGCRRPRILVWSEALGIQSTPKRPPFTLDAIPVAGRVAIAPECEWKSRLWPRHNFDEIARRLRAKGHDILWILKSHGWDFRELAEQVRSCSLLVGNDSMPAHMAGTVGTPAVIMFGQATHAPALAHYGPLIHPVEGHVPIESVRVDSVFAAALRALETSK